MARKPPKVPLAIVSSTAAPSGSDAPANLGAHGRNLWARITSSYDISDEGGRELLLACCQMTDRAEELRAAIDRDGAVVQTRNGPKIIPD